MNTEQAKPIYREFARQLLTFNYALYPALGQLDTVLSGLADCELKQRLKAAITELFFALCWQFPETIFRWHSELRADFDERSSAELAIIVERNQQSLQLDELESRDPDDIQPEFAKRLLGILYGLDPALDEIWACTQIMDSGPQKDSLEQAISEIMFVSLGDLMVPIYRRQPSLGRASEPGPWLAKLQQADAERCP